MEIGGRNRGGEIWWRKLIVLFWIIKFIFRYLSGDVEKVNEFLGLEFWGVVWVGVINLELVV